MMIDLPSDPVKPHQIGMKPARRSTTFLVTLVVFAFCIFPGAFSTWMAIAAQNDGVRRLIFCLGALVFFALPARIAFIATRRKLRTGQWSVTDEERRALRTKWADGAKPAWQKHIEPYLKYASYLCGLLFGALALLKFRVWYTRTHAPFDLIIVTIQALTAAIWILLAWTQTRKSRKREVLN